MATLNTETVLSGAAEDVLHALFFRGALPSGDLPSKAGATELRELGLAETRTTECKYHGEDYFTWLTPEGMARAIDRIARTDEQINTVTIRLELDDSGVVETLEKIGSKIRDSSAFRALACNADLSTSGPEDTLHEMLVATLPSTPTIELRARAEELAVAVNAAYAKLSTEDFTTKRAFIHFP